MNGYYKRLIDLSVIVNIDSVFFIIVYVVGKELKIKTSVRIFSNMDIRVKVGDIYLNNKDLD